MSNIPNNVNIHQDTPNSVTVNQSPPNSITVTTGSISAGTTKRYVHNQGISSSTWNITHSLGGRPQVTIVDSAGTVVYGEVQYLSNSEIRVLFSSGFSGYAYLT